jgi:Helix-loop-helix DNA-binding domain
MSLLVENLGEEPGSGPHQKPLCPIASLSSVTIECDLSNQSKKRQSTTYDQQPYPPKEARKSYTSKIACHSLVEKRYRTKLNDMLGMLRDNVPSLRVIPKRSEEYAYREGQEKLERPQASSKFDKATIISKAIEYIAYLETCNKCLGKEHAALRDRVSAIQKISCMDV